MPIYFTMTLVCSFSFIFVLSPLFFRVQCSDNICTRRAYRQSDKTMYECKMFNLFETTTITTQTMKVGIEAGALNVDVL